MFHNKQKTTNDASFTSPTKKLRRHVESLFLENKLSAKEVDELASSIGHCSVPGFDTKTSTGKNAARDWLRRTLKRNAWPPIYTANCTTWDNQLQTQRDSEIAFMLPHEVIFSLSKRNAFERLNQLTGATESVKRHIQFASGCLGREPIAIGLWSDSTPMNWDRSQSLELILMNLPGLPKDEGHSSWRFPLVAVPHDMIVKGITFEHIYTILAWSFQCLAIGKMPSTKHDGQAFEKADTWRIKCSGKILYPAVLCEMRADWKAFADIFHLPSWQHKAGICMRCNATTLTYKDMSSTAEYKQSRLTHWQFIERQLTLQRPLAAIYKVPMFNTSLFTLDWLHVVDLGVTASTLGNIFFALLKKLAPTVSEQVQHLLLLIREFYVKNDIKDGLGNLTLQMIKKDGCSPKLRAKGAEARSLVPFAKQFAEHWCNPTVPLESGILSVAQYLNQVHITGLDRSSFDAAAFQSAVNSFLLQYKALENVDEQLWLLKPKFHLLYELAQIGNCAAMNWNYRDEEAGGTLARMARSRGGLQTPWSVSKKCLQKFCCDFEIPYL